MAKKYVSVDVEASGRTPGKYSMLSLGACIVGDTEKQFYRELKPLNYNFLMDAMRVGCLGLRCLNGLKGEEYSPKSDKFNPHLVLKILEEKGEKPEDAMADFRNWIIESTKGYEPFLAAAPVAFDAMFISWYFDNFYSGENPFVHRGEDINSFYRGLVGDTEATIKNLDMSDTRTLPHNALEDAVFHAKMFEKILEMIKTK